jgi:hypothetical protein
MKTLTYIVLFVQLTCSAIAQDTICFINGSRKIAHVQKITMGNVVYRDTGKSIKDILIPKNSVRYILYPSGSYEIVSLKNIQPTEMNTSFTKGSDDADKLYRHPGGSIGTGIASFATGGILGLIPAIACSASKPRAQNLNLPRTAPLSDKSYMLGYQSRAKKLKQKRVWTGYFVGVAGAIALLLVSS